MREAHPTDDEGLTDTLRTHLTRLIAYAESADVSLQQEVAEKLANEAVKPERQQQIVEVSWLVCGRHATLRDE